MSNGTPFDIIGPEDSGGSHRKKEGNAVGEHTGKHTRLYSRRKREKNRIFTIVILLLCLVTTIAIGVTVWALFFRQPETSILAPDYAPQEIEQNAEDIGDSDADKLDAPAGGGAVSLMYQDTVSIDLSDKSISLMYGNPTESTMDILLQIIIQDNLIAQTGRLEPGQQVKKLDLGEAVAKTLQPGGYDGMFVVSFYNPETGEKSAVDTNIPITVTVSD